MLLNTYILSFIEVDIHLEHIIVHILLFVLSPAHPSVVPQLLTSTNEQQMVI